MGVDERGAFAGGKGLGSISIKKRGGRKRVKKCLNYDKILIIIPKVFISIPILMGVHACPHRYYRCHFT